MRVFINCLFVLCLITQNTYAAPTSESKSKTTTTSAANPKSLEANEQGVKALSAGNVKSAEDFFKQALQIDPGNLTAAYNLSGSYIVNEKRDAAIALLKEYTTKYPFDAGLWVRYGDVSFSAEKIKDAIMCYEKATALDSKYPKLTTKMGLAYALDQRLADSEKMYRMAITTSPKDSELLANLSSVTLANGKYDDAINFANRSIQISPASRTFITLGSAYEAKRAPVQALAAYERAKELGDKSTELDEKITQLKKLKV